MHAEKRGTLVKFITCVTSGGRDLVGHAIGVVQKSLPPDIMHVINFTKLPRVSAGINEKLGGAWGQGYGLTSANTIY